MMIRTSRNYNCDKGDISHISYVGPYPKVARWWYPDNLPDWTKTQFFGINLSPTLSIFEGEFRFVVWEKSGPILFRCHQCHHRLQLNYKRQEMTRTFRHYRATFYQWPAAPLFIPRLMLRQNTQVSPAFTSYLWQRRPADSVLFTGFRFFRYQGGGCTDFIL